MSNLTLPTMTRTALLNSLGDKHSKTIAHNTTAEKMPGGVRVRYHGNGIAELTEDRTWLGSAGWNTVTTSMRLDRIASDNGIPARVAIRKGHMVLLDPETLKVTESFYSASWSNGTRNISS